MDRTLFLDFNRAYAAEPTAEERQLVGDLLAVWGKLEPTAAKHPAMYRQGILFGMALQRAITAGEIVLKPVRRSRKTKPQGQAGEERRDG